MKLTTQFSLLLAIAGSTEAFMSVPSLATTKPTGLSIFMARSESFKRTNDRERRGRGGPSEYSNGGGEDFDYSGGNLKYGTGKYTQRANDGYGGGVNLSQNGRSMQDSVYREDRRNVDRARGRPRNDFGSRMDEIEDLERGMPREGMRDRMMRNRGGRNGGGMMRDANDMHDMENFGDSQFGMRDRMGGSGLLRDMQEDRRGGGVYDDFGSPPKIMGGSSHGRGGGYRSSQFESNISNERRRYEEFGHRMDEFDDYEGGGGGGMRRRGGRGGRSNFDRIMGRDSRDEYMDYDDYNRQDYEAGSRGMGDGRRGRGRGRDGDRDRDRDRYDDYGDDYGPGGGDGRLLRDVRR
eukprot:CAMPEP_0116142588 /NCGR_PEP_ID=MMETSP0329-20121206/14990_1 /TAXON_ID=697910 /ORGANISM="Pseudo-nitzschia arenysensis, Strain B593" /LENGTH=349 /DNA_ID=CAMNT_0003637837 /DNA_START=68 /DNA_END=1117 /DNA_ORIENTATION=-